VLCPPTALSVRSMPAVTSDFLSPLTLNFYFSPPQYPDNSSTATMAQASKSDTLCAMCEEPGGITCNDCRSIRYCSQTCHKTDWLVHKLLCKTFKDYDDSNRLQADDGSIYKRASYFPESGDSPHWCWMRFFGLNPIHFVSANNSNVPEEEGR
jgi:hypothetical protein